MKIVILDILGNKDLEICGLSLGYEDKEATSVLASMARLVATRLPLIVWMPKKEVVTIRAVGIVAVSRPISSEAKHGGMVDTVVAKTDVVGAEAFAFYPPPGPSHGRHSPSSPIYIPDALS
jgi:hypothetical protein